MDPSSPAHLVDVTWGAPGFVIHYGIFIVLALLNYSVYRRGEGRASAQGARAESRSAASVRGGGVTGPRTQGERARDTKKAATRTSKQSVCSNMGSARVRSGAL
jgi:hypothetical protein